MSDPDQEHSEVGRQLRETGVVPAPDDLAANVMRQVRAEPRPRRLHRRQPLGRQALTFALAAALLAAAVLGISQLDLGTGSSSSSGTVGSTQSGLAKSAEGDTTNGPLTSTYRQFTLGRATLRRLAGAGSFDSLLGVRVVRVADRFELYAPAGRYARVAAALARAAADFSTSAPGNRRAVTVRLYHLHR